MTKLELLVEALCEEIDASEHAIHQRGRGGQQVNGSFRDFAMAPPSVITKLKWWARCLREELPKGPGKDVE